LSFPAASVPAPQSIERLLVIRRDNIGDLVCTTPLIAALRRRFPRARICALVNSYNLPVLEGNPDLDAVYAYTKAKHRPPGTGILSVYWDRLRVMLALRRERFDYAIIAGATFLWRGLYLARQARPRHIIGFTPPQGHPRIDVGIPYTLPRPMHEIEDIFRLLAPLGIDGPPPPPRVFAAPGPVAEARSALHARNLGHSELMIGIHISARLPSNRWPAANFVALMRRLHERHGASFMLLWAPGSSSNAHHPGDDEKAREICDALPGLPVLPYRTEQLHELIAALALCDLVVCSDGGAMHIAAGLGKPIVCFFGDSDAARWHPWGVPYVLLQPESRDASYIRVDDGLAAATQLLEANRPQRSTGRGAC
jgi:heptosyltransferase-3